MTTTNHLDPGTDTVEDQSTFEGGLVVGVDWSESSQVALRWCADLAARIGVGVTLVHASSPWVGLEMAIPPLDTKVYERAVDRAVKEWAESLDGLAHRERVVEDDPAHALLTASSQLEPTLLVVGAHAGANWAPRMLGSVTSKVLHASSGPVALIPMSAQPGQGGPLVVGVDGSDASLRALHWAATMALTLGTEVYAVCVFPADVFAEKPRLAAHLGDDPLADTLEALRAIATQLGMETGAEIKSDVLIGHSGERLMSAGKESFALVLGKSGHNPLGEVVFGSTSHLVATHSDCPVIVVP